MASGFRNYYRTVVEGRAKSEIVPKRYTGDITTLIKEAALALTHSFFGSVLSGETDCRTFSRSHLMNGFTWATTSFDQNFWYRCYNFRSIPINEDTIGFFNKLKEQLNG